jgi:hypothetical protein
MSDLKIQGEVALDATGVETGVNKAKKSLATLHDGAKKTSDGMVTANARTSRSIDQFIAKQELAARSLGKTATEAKLFELAQRGASAAQLKSAEAALKSVDAFNAQEASAKRLHERASAAGAALATAFIAAGVAAATLGRSSINALDAFNDLADATGASIEGISALDRVARENGGTFDLVSTSLIRFNKVLSDSEDEGQKAARVLKGLGLDAAALKREDPAEAFRLTAVALAQFADDGEKARAVQVLFGKSVGEIAPLLKDVAEKTQLVGSASTQAAKDAEQFNKHMFALKANVQDAARAIVSDLVPALNNLASKYKEEGFLALFGFDKEFTRKKKLAGMAGDLISLKKQMDSLKGGIVSGRAGPGAESELATLTTQFEQAKAAFRAADKLFTPSDVQGGRGKVNPEFVKPRLEVAGDPAKTSGGAAKDPLAEAKRYLESLEDRVQKTKELTVLETVLADIDRGKFVVNDTLRERLTIVAKQLDADLASKKSTEEAGKAREKNLAMQQAADEAAAKTVEQTIASNQTLREEIEVIGLDTKALHKLEQARLANVIAAKELEVINARNVEGDTARVRLMEQEVELLKQQRALRDTRAEKVEIVEKDKESKEFAKSVNDDLKSAFQDAFTAGTRNPIKAFGESLYATITSRVSAALAESLATKALEYLGMGPGQNGGGAKSWLDILGNLGRSTFAPTSFGTGPGFGNLDLGTFLADGGTARANTINRVNERGPELLSIAGKDFLMMGAQSGTVTPTERLQAGGDTYVNVSVQAAPGMSRATALQQGAAYGEGIQRSLARAR